METNFELRTPIGIQWEQWKPQLRKNRVKNIALEVEGLHSTSLNCPTIHPMLNPGLQLFASGLSPPLEDPSGRLEQTKPARKLNSAVGNTNCQDTHFDLPGKEIIQQWKMQITAT